MIVGNSTPTSGTVGIGLGFQRYAAGFAMPGQDYTLTDVLLRLVAYDGPSEAVVSLYLDNAGAPGSLYATLIDPAAGSFSSDYTFLPSGTVTLAANTNYWLVVSAEPEHVFGWSRAVEDPMGVATFNGYAVSLTDPVIWITDQSRLVDVRFTINGEPVVASVPDGGSTAILLGIALLAFAFASRPRFALR